MVMYEHFMIQDFKQQKCLRIKSNSGAKFHVLLVVVLKIQTFWNVMACQWVSIYLSG